MASILLQTLGWTVFLGALILWPAGTLHYPGAWAFMALFLFGGGAILFWLGRYSPGLLRERMRSPIQREQKGWDKVFLTVLMAGFLLWLPLMGWEARRSGFHALPAAVEVLGGVLMALYMAGVWWTFRANAFAAPVVKIQQGQTVIDTGPYAIVRHPMYASALLFFLGLPLLLGAPWGLLVSLLLTLGIAWRAVREEEVLRAKLPGYEAYAQRVRFRLVPGLW
ncbi:isoprenylcysteine carboxyl methyltransferase [Azorhizobium oxalatiphilum]|uniref:Isoprenylcysteine carboxyl methyltransferase n=1 Tax=Azorhizobium oxalatiphilum TaxID=980631 RepID=A0A917F451_9HYPH|nr:isoprenylcysteine carboxylmethyltransferase family protein [Azorhizobium oxalatiphilum]GGF48565.1 isoprenylcysteine carboxyl methyltransferase [Azorhizobium oxalatiphilum]